MPRAYNEALIKCPFYISMSNKSISCEGIIEDCVTKLIFLTCSKRDLYRHTFCNDKYQNCEICKILNKKYE